MDVENDTTFAAFTQHGDKISVIPWPSMSLVSLATLKSPIGTTTIAAALLILYLAYRAILPKPIPGIPYNKHAARSPLGDIPEMFGYIRKKKEGFSWLGTLTEKHNSPIVQVFVRPFAKPWVVVTDPFETQDLLIRRGKDIDRSTSFGDLIGGLLPEEQIQWSSDDPRFKRNRNLVNHLMAPSFINRVSGPEAYRCVDLLIQLWKAKCERAQGRPFAAIHDLSHSALDAIAGSLLGLPQCENITWKRLEAVHQVSTPEPQGNADSSNLNNPIIFPDGSIPPFLGAIITLANSLVLTQLSPVPGLTYKIAKMLPFMKNAFATKEAYITSKINESLPLMTPENPDQTDNSLPPNALHSVLLRERQLAFKEGREPNYHSRAITDEFVGFLIAGYDSTAVTMSWGVKYLADHPSVQDRLRSELRAAMPAAFAQKRAPTYEEIVALHQGKSQQCSEYLDAVVMEVLRFANPIDFVLREAIRDTEILGRWIPKGTSLFMMGDGPGYVRPAVEVEDAVRSPGARKAGGSSGKMLSGKWDDGDLGEFKPERWLKMNKETGREEFDPFAGPMLAFGLVPRGCFGKRLAMMALRIHFVMIVWWFKLGKCPEELSGYEGVQRFAREPRRCFVRLEDAMGR